MRILPDPISRQSNNAIVQKREFWLPRRIFPDPRGELTTETRVQLGTEWWDCSALSIIVDALLRCADWRSGNYREVADLRACVKQINAHRIGTGSKKDLNFWTLIDARVPT
jgi:hypothetical protein